MSATTVWTTIALVALVTFVCKGIGPFAIGERELPAPLVRVVALLGSALLAALVVTSALAEGPELAVGAKTVGIGVASVLLWRRAHLVVVVVGAAAVTAALRAAGLS
ncbi:MAG: AzlD domain-containing protein [Mycobacteriales bacterium]|nr:AzlD domain-containing protein [Mycobacteriales bacterium]